MSQHHLPASFRVFSAFPRFRSCVVFCALLIVPALLAPVGATIELKIDEVTVEGGSVRFKVGSCSLDTSADAQSRQGMLSDETHGYLVYVDLANSPPPNLGSFVYSFIVQPKIPPGARACQFLVRAQPTGNFIDQIAEVTYYVSEGNQSETSSIRIPVHSARYSKPILESHPLEPIGKVGLRSETTILLSLANLLPDIPLEMGSEVRVVPENPGNWKKAAQAPRATIELPPAQKNILGAGQKIDTAIHLVLDPDPWHALGASMFPLEKGKPHETIHVNFDYRVPGGGAATLEIPVPVRFTPSFWSLLVAVLIGSAAGSLAGYWLLGGSAGRPWYVALLIGLFFGCLAELIGMVLVGYGNSSLRLFGFDLDPFQILPTLLVGALVGVAGFRKADDFLKLFGK